jgi:hypothetical protein
MGADLFRDFVYRWPVRLCRNCRGRRRDRLDLVLHLHCDLPDIPDPWAHGSAAALVFASSNGQK